MTHIHDQQLQDHIFSGMHFLQPEDKAHVLTCEACKTKLNSYILLDQQLKQLEPPMMKGNIYSSIQSRLQKMQHPKLMLPWHIPLIAFSIGILLFLFPKIELGHEFPIQLGLGLSLAIVLIFIEIKHLERMYKQKISKV